MDGNTKPLIALLAAEETPSFTDWLMSIYG